MKSFIIKSFAQSYEVQISDGYEFTKMPIEVFLELEPKFVLQESIRQLDYYPGILHEVILKDNSVEIKDLIWEEGDSYIANLHSYL